MNLNQGFYQLIQTVTKPIGIPFLSKRKIGYLATVNFGIHCIEALSKLLLLELDTTEGIIVFFSVQIENVT